MNSTHTHPSLTTCVRYTGTNVCALETSHHQLPNIMSLTSPVTKPAPTVFPATLIPWHYLHSTPLPPSTASATGSRSSHWFLVKKVLPGQTTFADWLVTVWQHWSLLSSLFSLSLPGGTAWCLLSSPFLFIWFSHNLLEFDGWDFCLSA